MGEIKGLLNKAVTLGLKDIMREEKRYSILSFVEPDGVHCIVDGDEYVISINPLNGCDSQSNHETNDHVSLDRRIDYILKELGISPGLKGYRATKEAILVGLDNKEAMEMMVKVLYPTVADRLHTTPSRVERSIRYSVEKAMDRGNVDYIHRLFGYTINLDKGKPTNTEFINTIIRVLESNVD